MGLETAAVAAIASGAISLGSSVGGFVSAGKRRREARDAADKADKAFKEAEQIATENVMAGIEIPKEAFEQQRETVLTGIGQTLQAAQEGSQRGAAAAGSRAGATANQLADRLRAGKEDALFRADLLERRGARGVQQDLANLKLGVAQGAQRERADLMNAAAALQAGATTNLASTAKQFLSAQNPFDKSEGDPTAQIESTSTLPSISPPELNIYGEPVQNNMGFLNPIGNNSVALGTTIFNPIQAPDPVGPVFVDQTNPFNRFTGFQMPGITGNY